MKEQARRGVPGASRRAQARLTGIRLALLAFAAPLMACGPAAAAPARLMPVEGAPPAPPLALAALDGTRPALPDGVAVVHVFATWCEPCRAELPALLRFAARRPGVPVFLVNVAEPEARVRRFLDSLPVPPPESRVLMDADRAAARAFGASLLPATFVVAGRRIVLALEGEVAWDDPATDAAIDSLSRDRPFQRQPEER